MDDRPGFLTTLLHTFYDFGFYRELVSSGVRAGLAYLAKLALVFGAIGVLVVSLQYYQVMTTLVRPAFADCPALSWKDGVLTADGRVPFQATIEEMQLTFAVDTSDTPDRSLMEGTDFGFLFTADRHLQQVRGELELDTVYGKTFDGRSIPAGKGYLHLIPEPGVLPPMALPRFVMQVLRLLFLLGAGSIIAAAGGVGILPDSRRLGAGAIWAVAAHAMTPAVAVFVAVEGVLGLSNPFREGTSAAWIARLVALAVGVAVTYLALRACLESGAQTAMAAEPPTDDDLLPPE